MAPKDLYLISQAYITTMDGTKEEFMGITQFGADDGTTYDKAMMYLAVSSKAGIFRGNIGHPPPAKISEEQVLFYSTQLKDTPGFENLAPEVKRRIYEEKTWVFKDLQEHIASVEAQATSRKQVQFGGSINTEKEWRKKIKEKNEEINRLKAEWAEERKDLLEKGEDGDDSFEDGKLGKVMRFLKESQEEIRTNSKKLDDIKKDMEYLINKKGTYNAFLQKFENPLSGGVDGASITLTIIGSEEVVTAIDKKKGPFGGDVKRLRGEGTLATVSLLDVSAIGLVHYILSKEPPKSSPAAKSAVIMFLDTTELEKCLTPGAIRFMGTSLKTNLSTVLDEALKFYSKVVFAIPPAPQYMIDSISEILKETEATANIIVINLSMFMDINKAKEGLDRHDIEATESPIKTSGWASTAVVSHVVGQAVQVLNPDCQFQMCSECWGCHTGACDNENHVGGFGKCIDVKEEEVEETICLRCLRAHPGECRAGTSVCTECNERGHLHKLHKVTDAALQETIRTNFWPEFKFVTRAGRSDTRVVDRGNNRGSDRGDNRGVVRFDNRGGDRGDVKRFKPSQQNKFPRLTAVIKK